MPRRSPDAERRRPARPPLRAMRVKHCTIRLLIVLSLLVVTALAATARIVDRARGSPTTDSAAPGPTLAAARQARASPGALPRLLLAPPSPPEPRLLVAAAGAGNAPRSPSSASSAPSAPAGGTPSWFGSRVTPTHGARCGAPKEIEAEIGEILVCEFADVIDAARDGTSLHQELSHVLALATERFPPRRAWDPERNALTDVRDVTLLRQYASDGLIRCVGLALPRLLQQRDLAPSAFIAESVACGEGGCKYFTDYMILRRALVDGEVVVTESLEVEEGDPRFEIARQESEAAVADYERAVESLLGLRVFDDAEETR